MRELTYTVPREWDGQTVQNYLRRECGLSWRMVNRLKRVEQGIAADGIRVRTIDRLREGQTVVLRLPDDTVRVEAVDLPLEVVYEDGHLLAVNKPPYIAVHPSAGRPEPTLANGVVAHYARQGEALAFRPLNRLDRNTSGLLLAAKNAHVAHALAGKVRKCYWAVAQGRLEGEGVIDQPIRVKEGCCITREVGEGGKESVTRWRAWGSDGAVTLLRVVIDTGRTHQIRVHMAWLGHPLAGDTLYGGDGGLLPRQGLHCGSMAFPHPITGEALRWDCPLPGDMADLLCRHGIRVPDKDEDFPNKL